ncbi:MAG: GNAT family protein [Bacteroidota bacterium]
MSVLCQVREMEVRDVPLIVSYWLDADSTFLEGMGVDLAKLPARDAMIHYLELQARLPLAEKESFCLIWEIDGTASGHCNLNPIRRGTEAWMHLHMWRSSKRRQGLGTELVKQSLTVFFETFDLPRIISEPYALNPAPNACLPKAGFQLEKEYVTTPGSLSFEQPVKRWVMERGSF